MKLFWIGNRMRVRHSLRYCQRLCQEKNWLDYQDLTYQEIIRYLMNKEKEEEGIDEFI